MARKTNPKYKKEELVKMIVDWTIDGVPHATIKNNIKSFGYEVSYFYLLKKEAKALIKEALIGVAEDRLAPTIIEMEEQYTLALDEGDRKLANEIRKEINKISGLHIVKTDITTNGDSINNISVIKIIEIKREEDETEN